MMIPGVLGDDAAHAASGDCLSLSKISRIDGVGPNYFLAL